jgi:plasmid stabilization system protein ParE
MLIEFLPEAASDLRDMGDYYRKVGGNTLARQMVGRIKSEILVLRDFPELPPIYELAPGIRRLVVASGAFLVFYRVRNNVEVLHVRRAEREPVTAEELERDF